MLLLSARRLDDGTRLLTSPGRTVSKRLDQGYGPSFSHVMKRAAAVFLGVLVCVAAGCTSGGAESDEVASVLVTPEVLRVGRSAYRKYCIQCHGYSGKGDGTSAASFDPPPRDYTNAKVMNTITDLTIAETIRSGGVESGFPNMPAFPHVSHDELAALVAYVRSLSRPGLASVEIGGVK